MPYTKKEILEANNKRCGRGVLTSEEAYERSFNTHNLIVLSSSFRDKPIFFFSDDHCFGVNVLPDNIVPCTMSFPHTVKERPGLEDGVIDSIEKYIQIFEKDTRQIKSIDELVDYLNETETNKS